MNGKINLSSIAEQAIGGVIAALLFSAVTQVINELSGGVYSIAVPLLIGTTVLIVALLLTLLSPPVRTFLTRVGAGAIAAFWWLLHNWQLLVGLILLCSVPVALYGFTRTCWAALVSLALEVACVFLARYEQTVWTFSGEGIGDFSDDGKKSWTPAVLCDPLYPDWIRLEGARWVWIKDHPTQQEAQQGQTVWHRVRVKIPRFLRRLRSATLYFVVDDYVNVFVNDALVRRREEGGAIIALDLGNYVHPGQNLVEMEIENAPMPGATWERNLAGITFILQLSLRLY
jgi:hypothetical protein